jgi:hypothetical protein
MARKRNQITTFVIGNMEKIVSHILGMSDSELAAWTRKAVTDLCNGCKDPNTDCLVREIYEKSKNIMEARQTYNSRYYQRNLARQGKSLKINNQDTTDVSTPGPISTNEASNPPTRESETRGPQTDNFNGDATTGDGVEAFQSRESGALVPTTISNISQDAPNGNAGEAIPSGRNAVLTGLLEHPAPIAESARCATSEAVKALADASTRKGEDGRDHRGNTGLLESSTSAKNFTLDSRTDKDRQPNRRTGGTPKRVEMPTASHAETLPVRSPAELKKPYGTCGHVMLTDTEGRHLREVYGPHLAIAIDILDGYIENDGKAAKKYKNHAAVLRKGNWVWNKVQEMILNEKRIENASKQGDRRSFRQQEREHQTELMHKSLFAPSIGMDNREITNG